MQRMEREKNLELESAALKLQVIQSMQSMQSMQTMQSMQSINAIKYNHLQVLESEMSHAAAEHSRTLTASTQLQSQVDSLTEQLDDYKSQCEALETEKYSINRQFAQLRDESEAEMATSSDIVDELARQNDELRKSQLR